MLYFSLQQSKNQDLFFSSGTTPKLSIWLIINQQIESALNSMEN